MGNLKCKFQLLSFLMLFSGCTPCFAQSPESIHLQASNYDVPAGMSPIRKADSVDQVELIRLTSTDIPELVKQACYSVGKVSLWKGNQGGEGSATYLGNGLWLTNRHVVEGGGTASVTLKSGQAYPARVTSISNSEPDLAVVETADLDSVVKPVPISSEQPTSGMTVYPSGFDFGRLDCHLCWPARIVRLFSDGDVESVGTGDRKGSISGNSGGPTFTANGELLAPLYANGGDSTRNGLGTCITVNSFACRTYLLPWRERIMRSLTQCGPRGCPPQQQYPQYRQQQGGPVQPPQYVIPVIPQQPQLPPQQQPPSYQPTPAPTPAPTVSGPRGEQGPKGDQGPQGLPGPKGEPGEITQKHLAIIADKVREALATDPTMKGPVGPVGPAGQAATVDTEAIVQEVLRRMPATRVVLVDGNSKKILDDETYKPGEALVFDINKLIKSR